MAGLKERWLAKQWQANSDGKSTEMLSSKLKIGDTMEFHNQETQS